MADWVHASCEAMYRDQGAPTAPLHEFIEEYEADDNVWWMIGSGHHQNLFEAAVERAQALEALVVQGLIAFQHTREYIGEATLPNIEGWSHYDWCEKARKALEQPT